MDADNGNTITEDTVYNEQYNDEQYNMNNNNEVSIEGELPEDTMSVSKT